MSHQCGIYELDEKNEIKHINGYPIKTKYYNNNCHMYGSIEKCYEKNGKLWVDNVEEYESQVNFCPFCGYEAKVKIPEYIGEDTSSSDDV